MENEYKIRNSIRRSPEVQQKLKDIIQQYIKLDGSRKRLENLHSIIMSEQWESK